MKRLLPAFFLLCFCSLAFAQDIEVKMGPSLSGSELRDMFQAPPSRIKLRYGSSIGRLMFFNTSKQIAYQGFGSSPKKGFQIGEFSDYVSLEATHMLHSDQKISEDGSIYIQGFISIGNTPFILYSVNDKANNEERVYVNQLDAKMKMLGSPVLLITFDGRKSFYSPIYLSASPDEKTFAIAREYVERGATEKIVVKLFNREFKSLHSGSIEIRELQELFVLSEVAVSNNQNVYLFGAVDPRADNVVVFAGGKNKATPLLWAYQTKNKKLHKIDVAEPGIKRYHHYQFYLADDNAPVVVSLYKDKRNIAYRLDQLNDNNFSTNWKYTGTLSDAQEKAIKKYRGEPEYLESKTFTRFSNGNYLATFSTDFQLASNTAAYSVTGSILAIGFSPEGSKLWEKTIFANHRLQDTKQHTSHLALADAQNVHILFNDHHSNVRLAPNSPNNKRIKKYKDAALVSVSISPDGSMTKTPLLSGPEWLGYSLDLFHFAKIRPGFYQIKLAKYGFLGKYDLSYGTLRLTNPGVQSAGLK